MDFYTTLEQVEQGFAYNPYAGKNVDDTWLAGEISIDFLNSNFGQYNTATEMKAATTSEGLHMFFDYLAQQGKLPA